MRAVMVIPTGLGCPLGGHAGDANAAARLLGAACDELIVHPNVVNASDINEMPANSLYVDGHALDLFLEGEIALRRVRSGSNRVLVVTNKPISAATQNAVGAASATLGLQAEILELGTELYMRAFLDSETGAATGDYSGVYHLIDQVKNHDAPFDALAISSAIDIDRNVAEHYLRKGGVNPWGKIEAIVSRVISRQLTVPVAHAPIDCVISDWEEVVDERSAAECVSIAYLHCVLKGLHRAPKLIPFAEQRSSDLTVEDIDILVSPFFCWGRPHEACVAAGIEVVWVKENQPSVRNMSRRVRLGEYTEVANYLEVAGLIAARRAGVSVESVMRTR